jgi:hypothetical protein
VVLEPVSARIFFAKIEMGRFWYGKYPKYQSCKKRFGKRLGETAGGGGMFWPEFRTGMKVDHDKSCGPSYTCSSLYAMAHIHVPVQIT